MQNLLKTGLEHKYLFELEDEKPKLMNGHSRLKKNYCEMNKELGKTGAGLTIDEIRQNPDLANILGILVSSACLNQSTKLCIVLPDLLLKKFPFWEQLHGFWQKLPNFNPYTISSEPGQDLVDEARKILQRD